MLKWWKANRWRLMPREIVTPDHDPSSRGMDVQGVGGDLMRFLLSAIFVAFAVNSANADPLDRLVDEVIKLDTAPCETPLYLFRDPVIGQWNITCDGCAARPLREVFEGVDMLPVAELAEEMKTPDGRFELLDMYLLAGQCSAKHLKW